MGDKGPELMRFGLNTRQKNFFPNRMLDFAVWDSLAEPWQDPSPFSATYQSTDGK